MSQNRWCNAERLKCGWYKLAENCVHQAPRERSLCLGTSFLMRLKPAPAREEHPEDVQRVMAKKKCWKFWNFQKFWNSENFENQNFEFSGFFWKFCIDLALLVTRASLIKKYFWIFFSDQEIIFWFLDNKTFFGQKLSKFDENITHRKLTYSASNLEIPWTEWCLELEKIGSESSGQAESDYHPYSCVFYGMNRSRAC